MSPTERAAEHPATGAEASRTVRFNLAGAIHAGEQVCVGVGAVVRDRLTVGAHAMIGAGAVVVADVAEGTTAFGVLPRLSRGAEPVD